MKASAFSDAQKAFILKQVADGVPVAEICRRAGISQAKSHDQLRDHLAAFVAAYNFAKRLKTLGGLTPFQAICKAWTDQPSRFRLSPDHLTSGLNI